MFKWDLSKGDCGTKIIMLPMNDFIQLPMPIFTIGPASKESIGEALGTQGWTDTSNSTANRSILWPFYIYQSISVKQMICMNGRTVSGNLDMGIYTVDGSLAGHTGAKAQVGTNRPQAVAVSFNLAPGAYWLALVLDNTSGFFYRRSPNVAAFGQSCGIAHVLNNFPLAEKITPVPITTTWLFRS